MSERPHCLAPTACTAKTLGKHCVRCAARSPDVRAKKAAGLRKALASPEMREKWRAASLLWSRNPDVIANRMAANAEHRKDPKFRERHAEACRAAKRKRMQDPEFAAMLRAAGERLADRNRKCAQTPEVRAAAIEAARRRRLTWCPEEFWELNQHLKRKGLLLSERQDVILAEVPGTQQHARREIANNRIKNRLKHEKDLAQRY